MSTGATSPSFVESIVHVFGDRVSATKMAPTLRRYCCRSKSRGRVFPSRLHVLRQGLRYESGPTQTLYSCPLTSGSRISPSSLHGHSVDQLTVEYGRRLCFLPPQGYVSNPVLNPPTCSLDPGDDAGLFAVHLWRRELRDGLGPREGEGRHVGRPGVAEHPCRLQQGPRTGLSDILRRRVVYACIFVYVDCRVWMRTNAAGRGGISHLFCVSGNAFLFWRVGRERVTLGAAPKRTRQETSSSSC